MVCHRRGQQLPDYAEHWGSAYNIILDSDGMFDVILNHILLRLGAICMPPIGDFPLIRERVKGDACSAKLAVAVAVESGLVPAAGAVGAAAFGRPVGD